MTGARIQQVATLTLTGTLMEVHFTLTCVEGTTKFVKLAISSDGETITYQTASTSLVPSLLPTSLYQYEVATVASGAHASLAALVGQVVQQVQVGFTPATVPGSLLLYYVRAQLGQVDFLFFNNGDEGYYGLNMSERLLADDIYQVQSSDC
jgi:hypothetical protein